MKICDTKALIQVLNTFTSIVVTHQGVIIQGNKKDALYIKEEAKKRFNIDVEIIQYVTYQFNFDGYLINVTV